MNEWRKRMAENSIRVVARIVANPESVEQELSSIGG